MTVEEKNKKLEILKKQASELKKEVEYYDHILLNIKGIKNWICA